jgi:GNAT superfamily N-acetyltransferase
MPNHIVRSLEDSLGSHADPPFIVAAPAHPSLDGAIIRFCDALRNETRWLGQRGALSSKPAPSLIRRLEADEPGLRLAAVHDGEIVGVARIDTTAACGPELLVAVAEPWRRRGVALALGRAIVGRAHLVGIERIVVRTSSRGAEIREVGAALGFRVVDLGGGRVDLVRALPPASQTA